MKTLWDFQILKNDIFKGLKVGSALRFIRKECILFSCNS